MKRQDFIKLMAASGLSLTGCQNIVEPDNASQPNFVFILADDLGWSDLGCFGSSFYETPNLDRLSERGVKFTHAYAACPVCSPTRASILSGKYPARMDTTDYFGAKQGDAWKRNTKLKPAPYIERLQHEEITIAEALKEEGYATFFAGKWHCGPEGWFPEDQGFDINKGGQRGGGPYGGKKYFSPYGNSRLEDGPDGEHLPDRLAQETCQFIRDNKDEPFLAYLSFYSVHTPLMTRQDLKEKYEKKKSNIGSDVTWGQERGRRVRQTQNHAIYAGMVEAMDQAIGKVMAQLEVSGLDENTVIIFMSDNGGLSTSEGSPTSNLPLRAGKGWLYEGGIREPMIISWPGVTLGEQESTVPVTSTDFYPTILSMAGIPSKPQQHLDGVDLVPLLKGKGSVEREAIFWHYPHYGNQGSSPGSAIRKGDWKLIEWFEDGKLELFNLSEDIGEKNDLSKKELERTSLLHRELVAWRKSVDAKLPTPNPRFNPKRRIWK